MRRPAAQAAIALALMLAVSCGSTADATAPRHRSHAAVPTAAHPTQLSFRLVDYGFDGPGTAPAGPTRITVTNVAKQLHQLTIARIPDGMSYDHIQRLAMAGDEDGLTSMVQVLGGVNAVSPGESATTDVELDQPGNYALLCFIPDQGDGKSHLMKGMIKPFTVTGRAQAPGSPTTTIATAAHVSMREFGYDGVDSIKTSGPVTFENDGTQDHEAIVFRYAPGKTKADLLAYFGKLSTGTLGPDEQPPGVAIGGVAATATAHAATARLDLPPGHYAMFCAISDPQHGGVPHVLEGMYSEFDVTG